MVVVDEQLLGGLIKNPIQYIKHPEIGIRLSAEDSDTSDCKYNVCLLYTSDAADE